MKIRPPQSRRSQFYAVTSAALLSGLAAGGYSISYTQSSSEVGPFPALPGTFPISIDLPQFNNMLPALPPAHQGLAFLIGVQLEFTALFRVDNLGLENTSPVPADITFSQVINSTFKYPTPVSNPTETTEALNPDVTFTENFPTYDGTTDFGGTSGKTYTFPDPLLEDSKSSLVSVLSSDWVAYQGAANFTVRYDVLIPNPPSITADAGKTFAYFLPEEYAKGMVKVTYFYDIPETSTVAAGAGLVLLLGAAGWRMRRRA